MKIENQTSDVRLGECPACSTAVYATVDLEFEVKIPDVVEPNSFQLNIVPTIVGAHVTTHVCGTLAIEAGEG